MIETVKSENFNEVLPLISEYQKFYKNDDICDNKNRKFFSQFIQSHENGVLHLYRHENNVVGFSTLYKGISSSRAEAVVILNDLYVKPEYRKQGFGRVLVNHAIDKAKHMGYKRLQWLTAQDNVIAKNLYNSLNTSKSAWCFYVKEI